MNEVIASSRTQLARNGHIDGTMASINILISTSRRSFILAAIAHVEFRAGEQGPLREPPQPREVWMRRATRLSSESHRGGWTHDLSVGGVASQYHCDEWPLRGRLRTFRR